MHMNDTAPTAWYMPLLKTPILLHSSRDPGKCTLTPERCAYKSRYWVFWYEADHVFALPTVYFFLAVIAVFALGHFASAYAPARLTRQSSPWRRAVAGLRFCAYKTWRVGGGGRSSSGIFFSQSLGAYLLLGAGVVFFAAMTLGPRPYYWPTDAKYGSSPPLATRTGWMALACMPFILLLSSKANVISAVTGIPPEKLNVWHSWVSWAMFVLALIHTFPFIIYRRDVTHDLHKTWITGGVWLTGVIALVAQTWLTFMSISWIRNKFYEFFKATHFFFAIVFVVFFFIHCAFRLSSWDYFIAAVSLYVACLLFAFAKTYLRHGINHAAHIRCETPHSLRIAVATTSSWRPGQHVFLRFVACGAHALTAHPLTICSLPDTDQVGSRGEMVFFVQPRGGLTGHLAALARNQPNKSVSVLLEGPYGGMPSRWGKGFDRTLLVAGGSGCGFTLALIESWLRAGASLNGQRQLEVVLATRDPEMRIWYMEELQRLAERQSVQGKTELPGVSVSFCETHDQSVVTGPDPGSSSGDEEKRAVVRNVRQPDGSSTITSLFGVCFSHGRPDTKAAVHRLASADGVTVGVAVCGPASMVYDVGVAAAAAQLRIVQGRPGATELFLHKEAFS
ncbi:Flavoprotein transmembrane component [Beauveria brongniartii RCEF 3172]|uniref:ferric-chelate reductase (NADPH) n=1 Tax=Beauveria brongniartii RCEF 3172 TaxID=1081107 RepID=A0A167GZC8_9HYPO|nr:Flavoprotein transmembrane component [Beauveria brongniartii RCEF 3172]